MARRLLESALSVHRALIEHLDPRGRDTFFATDGLPWVRAVEARWPMIRDELDCVLDDRDALPAFHDVSPRQAPISSSAWKSLFFWVYGRPVLPALAMCPNTAAAIGTIPGIKMAMFSILG